MEQEIVAGLVARGVPEYIAAGMARRMRAESGLDPGVSEIAPTVPGSRGGYGLNQWTGPRRRQFEAFAADRGARPDDLATQLDFTVWELGNTERAAYDAMLGAATPADAERLYMEKFLRPGVAHADMRGGRGGARTPPVNALADGRRNALPDPAFPRPDAWRTDVRQIDAEAFMRPRNALAFAPLVYEKRNVLGAL